MKRDHARVAPASLAAAALLAGCSMMPAYERPAAPVPADWPYAGRRPRARRPPQLDWQDFFADARLRELIAHRRCATTATCAWRC